MKGTEKIIARIRADGDAEAKRILDEAAAQAEKLRAESFNAALAEHKRLTNAGAADCENIISSGMRTADMEAKKSILALKQELVTETFDAAAAEIRSMPREDYVAFLARMAASASATGTEELVLSEQDRSEVGKDVCKAANELLRSAGRQGGLTVSEDTADISGGVIVRHGGIETNCSIDALIRQRRSGLSAEVAAMLFE